MSVMKAVGLLKPDSWELVDWCAHLRCYEKCHSGRQKVHILFLLAFLWEWALPVPEVLANAAATSCSSSKNHFGFSGIKENAFLGGWMLLYMKESKFWRLHTKIWMLESYPFLLINNKLVYLKSTLWYFPSSLPAVCR